MNVENNTTYNPFTLNYFKRPNALYLAGTNVTFTISKGDGSPEQFQHSLTDNFREFSLPHHYEHAGIYNAMIKARNDVGEKEIECNVIVEDVIANLTLAVPPPRIKDGSKFIYISIGESITIEGKIRKGTSVNCTFDFGEEAITKGIDVFKATHTYRQNGNYSVGLTCINRVSSAYKKHSKNVVVQKDEPISNLRILRNVTRKGEHSVFTLVKSTGTAFVCNWTFGDSTTFQTDISDMGTPIFHQYSVEGAFDVSVRCTNRHGVVEAKGVAWVQIPVKDITCYSLQTYVNMSEEASFNMSVHSGSHLTIVAEFEANQTQNISLKEGFNVRKYFILKHSYMSNGSYEVKVTASNRLGILTTQCKPVIVQKPLRNIILSSDTKTIKVSNEVVFTLKIPDFDEFLPTDASCLWSFGDNSPVHEKRLMFNMYGIDTMRHRYLFKGAFITRVACSNKVSRTFLDTAVTVLEPVNPVMKVCLDCDHSTKITEISSKDYFTVGDKVTFLLTSQDFDKTYQWMMTEHGVLGHTNEPYFSTILNKTGTFTASVVVDKVVERLSASVNFIVQQKISGVLFMSSGFTWLKSPSTFRVILPKFQYGDCFVIFSSDSFNLKGNRTGCASKSTDGATSSLELSFNHTFLHEGNYTVCLTVFNQVSEVRRCLSIEVVKPVCKIENVSIWDSNRDMSDKMEDRLQSVKYNKSLPFKLEGHFIKSCLLPDSKGEKLSWQIKRINSDGGELDAVRRRRRNLEAAELVWESEGSEIKVDARSLDYDKYYFVFTVELTSVDVKTLYGPVFGETRLKVEIVRSPIAGKIAGERIRDVDIEGKLRLDANFYDPDLPPGNGQTNMKFDWYCKTQFQPNGPFVHCFDQRKSFDSFPITTLTSPVFITTLERYVANKTYIFSVKVIKEGDNRTAWDEVSVFILPPGPPKMRIR